VCQSLHTQQADLLQSIEQLFRINASKPSGVCEFRFGSKKKPFTLTKLDHNVFTFENFKDFELIGICAKDGCDYYRSRYEDSTGMEMGYRRMVQLVQDNYSKKKKADRGELDFRARAKLSGINRDFGQKIPGPVVQLIPDVQKPESDLETPEGEKIFSNSDSGPPEQGLVTADLDLGPDPEKMIENDQKLDFTDWEMSTIKIQFDESQINSGDEIEKIEPSCIFTNPTSREQKDAEKLKKIKAQKLKRVDPSQDLDGPSIEATDGTWHTAPEGELFNGLGKKFSKNKRLIYSGYFKNSKFHSSGQKYRITSDNPTGGLLYVGTFLDNEFHGTGKKYFDEEPTLQTPNSAKDLPNYEGEFQKGAYHGKGVKYSKSGIKIYEGQFENGKYHGQGTLYKENNGEK
jgi:hypothetical protein